MVPSTKRKRASSGHATSLPNEIEVYEVQTLNRWPYDSVKSVTVALASQPLVLTTDLRGDTKYRCYEPEGTAYVSWALVPWNFYGDARLPNDDASELSPARLVRPAERWLQIEYVMFHSCSRNDDARLDFARDRHASGELSYNGLTAGLRPDRSELGTFEDPHYAWHNSGRATRAADKTLFISRRSNLPYINYQTIPDGADYEFVNASVFCYKAYRSTPTYAECLKSLRTYCHWFETYLLAKPG